ncbi:MAG: hypothetical protein AB8G05_09995 [Oligoflexales bacterium]
MTKVIPLLAMLLCSSVQAKTIYYGSERENISISYGVSTLLRFDEEVKTITQASKFEIKPADPNKPDYRILSIKPRSKKARSNVTFILANDVVVNAKLNTVVSKLHETTNTFYDLKAKSLRIDPIARSSRGGSVSEVELMKAMIRVDRVIGYKARTLSQTVRTGIDGITARLVKVYTGPKFHGYIFKVTNNSKDKTYALDVKSLTLGRPNVALLSQSDSNILYPKQKQEPQLNSTLLRIVAKPTSVYYSISLPVAPITNSK